MYVYKRPYLKEFLNGVKDLGDVYIYTASVKTYADPIIDSIDPKGVISGRFYREDCRIDKSGNIQKLMNIIT